MVNALKYTKELEKAGFSHEQAETSIKVLYEVMDDNFATKLDLKELEYATRADIKASEQNLRSELKESEQNLRSELKESEQNLKSELKALEHRMDLQFADVNSRFRDLENKLVIKLGAIQAASVGLIVALLKL